MKHCLVVDDSRVIRKVACRILQSLSFETDEAEDGPAALDACRRRMPELILLDWNMPGGGADFLRSLRREQGGAEPVVVFCTTENDVDGISEAMIAGANDYVLKPFDRGLIEEKLAEVGLI